MSGPNTYSIAAADGTFTGGRFIGTAEQLVFHLRDHLPAGAIAVEGVHNPANRRVDIATGAVVAFRPVPPPDDALRTWCWHEASERWVAEPTLAAFQAEAWARVKAGREASQSAPVDMGGHAFDAGPASRAALAQKALAAHVAWTAGSGAEWTVAWTTADNDTVILGAREVINLALALDQRDQADHELSQALRKAIAAATTKAALDAICWPA